MFTPSAARPTRHLRGSTRRSSIPTRARQIAVQNLFDKIHSDPRWLPFLRKIGKAPDQLAKIKFEKIVDTLAPDRTTRYSKLPAPTAEVQSVAVLPLRNLTGNPDNEYLTDGITEGLIRGLSKSEGLKVISRTSAFAFKGKEIDPREVGGQLDAMTIVQGSIRQSQSGVRVSVQLVRTSDGSAIWSGESFDHTLSNALTLESELIRSVAGAIRPNLRDEQENRMARRYTENSEAYQVYLRGRYLWNKRTGADAEHAIRCFEQAITLDPNFALAYSGLADVYVTQGYFTDRPFSETRPKARAAAEKALSIDNNLSDAHATLAFILAGDMDLAGAEKEYKLAQDLDPDCPTAHSRYGFLLMHAGRLDQSLREMQRAVELDPLSIEMNTDLGIVLNVSSHLDEAVARYQIALEMDRNFTDAHGGLGCTYRRKGDLRRSIAELETAHQLSPKRPDLLAELGCSYALAGEIDKATSVIEELKAMPPPNNVSPFHFAKVYAALEQNDKAVDAFGIHLSDATGRYLQRFSRSHLRLSSR